MIVKIWEWIYQTACLHVTCDISVMSATSLTIFVEYQITHLHNTRNLQMIAFHDCAVADSALADLRCMLCTV